MRANWTIIVTYLAFIDCNTKSSNFHPSFCYIDATISNTITAKQLKNYAISDYKTFTISQKQESHPSIPIKTKTTTTIHSIHPHHGIIRRSYSKRRAALRILHLHYLHQPRRIKGCLSDYALQSYIL